MIRILYLAAFLFLLKTTATAQLQSPDEFLPHQWGAQFTPHHTLVDYMKHVAASSNRMVLTTYGQTNENRPLLLAFLSTPENLAQLEAIRLNNLRRAGFLPGAPDPGLNQVIVWLSFSVHGNEAAGSESSMQVVYELADPANAATQAWLKNTIVVLDPSINPDGYSRYTHWYRGVSNTIPDPNPDAAEHQEPWPGGRVNHYLFDLNRDWAWQTQVESQQRLKKYKEWLPQVHADLHEMGANAHYYFAPAARPYHAYITDWQAAFQQEIGKNHAKYFHQNGWLYFTREVYDLLYPSYGDTYPTYHGAIGMTYEQAGGGRAGRAIIIENGDTLTLKDRVLHHRATALSTVEVSSQNAARLLQEFEKYHREAQTNPPGDYKTYVIKGDNPTGRLQAFTALLDKNQILYGKAARIGNHRGLDYLTGQESPLKIEENDLLISAYQPEAILTQILLEPQTALEDSLTYDITAWALPYAYGLKAFALKEKIKVEAGYDFPPVEDSFDAAPYAYLATWESLPDARFLSQLLAAGVKVRFAEKAFTQEGIQYAPGTLVITRADNRKLGAAFDRLVQETALRLRHPLRSVSSGMVTAGSDFGARSMRFLETPRIAVLSGEGTSSNSFGQVWYYLEQNLNYPFSAIRAEELSDSNLDKFNVLIMPEGRYNFGNNLGEQLENWVSGGGRLIAIGSANRALGRISRLALEQQNGPKAQGTDEQPVYGDRVRESISEDIPGAIFQVRMDATHPLAFGLGNTYFTLKTGTEAFPVQENAWNVGTIGEDPMILGFAGAKAKEDMKKSLVFGVRELDNGAVVYLVDNPLFRGFWENGKFLFSNALFFAGQ